MELAESLDLLHVDVVLKGFLSSRPRLPVDSQINQVAAIDRDHPVVWEVFVADLTHLRFGKLKDRGAEGQQGEDDAGLARQCETAVSGVVAVDCQLLVDVIILHGVDQGLDELALEPES